VTSSSESHLAGALSSSLGNLTTRALICWSILFALSSSPSSSSISSTTAVKKSKDCTRPELVVRVVPVVARLLLLVVTVRLVLSSLGSPVLLPCAGAADDLPSSRRQERLFIRSRLCDREWFGSFLHLFFLCRTSALDSLLLFCQAPDQTRFQYVSRLLDGSPVFIVRSWTQ
jgi:hypothetical protein